MKHKSTSLPANYRLNRDQIANLASEFYGKVLYSAVSGYRIEFAETDLISERMTPEQLMDLFLSVLKNFEVS